MSAPDGFGNIKTTIPTRSRDLNLANLMRITLTDCEVEARMSDGAFTVPHGQLTFVPESSGWPVAGGNEVRWMEIVLRGDNAWKLFKGPPIDAALSIVP